VVRMGAADDSEHAVAQDPSRFARWLDERLALMEERRARRLRQRVCRLPDVIGVVPLPNDGDTDHALRVLSLRPVLDLDSVLVPDVPAWLEWREGDVVLPIEVEYPMPWDPRWRNKTQAVSESRGWITTFVGVTRSAAAWRALESLTQSGALGGVLPRTTTDRPSP
jgi:hypothetical protein